MASSSASQIPPLGKYLASTGTLNFKSIVLPVTLLQIKRRGIKLSRISPHSSRIQIALTFLITKWTNYGKGFFIVRFHLKSQKKKKKKGFVTLLVGFWMSDKALVQQALASELANILLSIDHNSASFEFLGGFWRTIVREWEGIDRLR
jgi:hypothetical protein